MKILNVLQATVASTLLTTALVASGHTSHWGYTGHNGPENWGALDPKYTMCKVGKTQSPINIDASVTLKAKGLSAIHFDYQTGASSVVNNGHTVQVNIKDGSSIKLDGKLFSLKQFHFHTPSENQIDGKNFPLEAHFVHVAADGSLAVVSVMFESGKENATLKKIWGKVSHKVSESKTCGLSAQVINDFLPRDKSYYRFTGSLTTPPCSEGVRWMVLKGYSHISEAQVAQFSKMVHGANNRPIQAINARKVVK